jgi:hypothetical protein
MQATTMPSVSSPLELVTLHSGRVLPLEVISRAIDLNGRGVRLWRDPDGYLRATPKELLTEADRAFLRANRDAVLIAVDEDAEAAPC